MKCQEENVLDIALEAGEKRHNVGEISASNDLERPTSISSLLTQIAACSYDRAKEIAESEIESFRSINNEKSSEGYHAIRPNPELSIHLAVFKLLTQICSCEKSYGSLAFLSGSKSIFKKENSLKIAYGSVYNELCKLGALSAFKAKDTPTRRIQSPLPSYGEQFQRNDETGKVSLKTKVNDTLASSEKLPFCLQANPQSIINDLMCFVSLRLELMEIYDRICGLGESSLAVQGPQLTTVSRAAFSSGNLKLNTSNLVSCPIDEVKLKPKLTGATGGTNAIDYYEVTTSRWTLANMKNKSIFMPYKTVIIPMLEKVESQYNMQLKTSCLQNLAKYIFWELEALKGLLKALLQLDEFSFYQCLININSASSHLVVWEDFIKANRENTLTNNQNQSGKLSSSFTGGKGIFESFWNRKANTTQSAARQNVVEQEKATFGSSLFRWLLRLNDIVLSKFTFLFYEQLSTQTPSIEYMRSMYDEKISSLRNGINFVQKVELFLKSILLKENNPDCSCFVALISEKKSKFIEKGAELGFNKNLENIEKESGTAHNLLFSLSCTSSVTNLSIEDSKKEKSFESSISFEIGAGSNDQIRKIHLPIISNQVQEEITWTHLSRPNQVIHFECGSSHSKYFLLRMEPQVVMALVISFATKTKENYMHLTNPPTSPLPNNHIDLQEVLQFVHGIALETRCNNIFASLKGVPLYT